VEVNHLPKCWETVFIGQTVMVKVEAVEQLAWQEPRILGSLVEGTGDNIVPLIDFVEEFDDEVTDGGLFEQNHTRKSQGQKDSQASSTSMGTARGDGWLQSSYKKRKVLEDSPASEASPVKKKPKKDLKSSPLVTVHNSAEKSKLNTKSSSADPESYASPHTPSHTPHNHLVKSPDPVAQASPVKKKPKPSPPVTETKAVRKTGHKSKSQSSSSEPSTEPSPAVTPSHQHPMPSPLATSPSKTKKKASANNLSQTLHKPAKSKSADSGHDSNDDDEVDNAETANKPRILMSGLDRSILSELTAIVTRLCGVVNNRPRWSTHLVMDKLDRTSNMLLCLPTVKHVLSTKWILESGKAGRWLEEGDYDLRDAKVEQHYEFSLSETLAKTKRDQLFKGVVFYITPSVQPSFDTLNKIIIHSGGRGARYAARRWSVDQMKEMNSAGHLFYIIITCEDDIHMVEDVLRAGIGVFSSEFVMSSVLRGGIDDDLSKYLTYADPSI